MCLWCHLRYQNISIHTPARGVTRPLSIMERSDTISIHTPARGVTEMVVPDAIRLAISIHTPARGVTQMVRYGRIDILFQSTHPRGV
mgnify:CR=1 FL=1